MNEYRDRYARAYRDGELVCGRVELVIRRDETRLGLAPRERAYVVMRFLEDLERDLRGELWLLTKRRGRAAKRIADDLEPIELAFVDPQGRRRRIAGRLEAPLVRSGGLRDIEFGLRAPKRAGTAIPVGSAPRLRDGPAGTASTLR
jgi:hypothetical protein